MALPRGFQVLDTSILLTGPDAALRPIVSAYSRFAVPEETLETPLRLEVDANCRRISVNGVDRKMVTELDPTFQVYQEFLTLVLQNVRSHAVLHGAALRSHDGGCFMISAPSGHGKSSMALALVDRGYGFLSDDYAPLHLNDRTIHPYPRTVSVVPGESALIPDRFRDAANDPDVTRLFGKSLVDVGRILGEQALVPTPLPLRRVFIVTGGVGEEDPATTLLDVAARSYAADEIEDSLGGVDGVEILKVRDQGYLRRWLLRMSHDRHPTRRIAEVMDHEAILLCEKHWVEKPIFDRAPEAWPIKRRVAATLLARELLNRRGGSRLLDAYDGSVTGLFLDLAGALRDAECWRVQTGYFEETIELVEKLVNSPVEG